MDNKEKHTPIVNTHEEQLYEWCLSCNKRLRHILSQESGYCGLCTQRFHPRRNGRSVEEEADELLVLFEHGVWARNDHLVRHCVYHRKQLYTRLVVLEKKGFLERKIGVGRGGRGRTSYWRITSKGASHRRLITDEGVL